MAGYGFRVLCQSLIVAALRALNTELIILLFSYLINCLDNGHMNRVSGFNRIALLLRLLQTQQAHPQKDHSNNKNRDIGYESHNTPLSFYH